MAVSGVIFRQLAPFPLKYAFHPASALIRSIAAPMLSPERPWCACSSILTRSMGAVTAALYVSGVF